MSLSSLCLKWESLAIRFSVDLLYRMALLSWTMAPLAPRWKAASTANANGQSTSKGSQYDSLIVTWLCNVFVAVPAFLFLLFHYFQRCHRFIDQKAVINVSLSRSTNCRLQVKLFHGWFIPPEGSARHTMLETGFCRMRWRRSCNCYKGRPLELPSRNNKLKNGKWCDPFSKYFYIVCTGMIQESKKII